LKDAAFVAADVVVAADVAVRLPVVELLAAGVADQLAGWPFAALPVGQLVVEPLAAGVAVLPPFAELPVVALPVVALPVVAGVADPSVVGVADPSVVDGLVELPVVGVADPSVVDGPAALPVELPAGQPVVAVVERQVAVVAAFAGVVAFADHAGVVGRLVAGVADLPAVGVVGRRPVADVPVPGRVAVLPGQLVVAVVVRQVVAAADFAFRRDDHYAVAG
jgi:hypothetical protein